MRRRVGGPDGGPGSEPREGLRCGEQLPDATDDDERADATAALAAHTATSSGGCSLRWKRLLRGDPRVNGRLHATSTKESKNHLLFLRVHPLFSLSLFLPFFLSLTLSLCLLASPLTRCCTCMQATFRAKEEKETKDENKRRYYLPEVYIYVWEHLFLGS